MYKKVFLYINFFLVYSSVSDSIDVDEMGEGEGLDEGQCCLSA